MTNSIIVKNCPAGQVVTSAVNPKLAGVYCKKEHKPCQDCVHCVIKKIITRCQQHLQGRILMANDILEWLDTEEIQG